MSGWICSYRKIWQNEFFRGNGMRVAVWHWLLHHAAWEDTTHNIGAAIIEVRRGEVCFSQQQVSDETGASRKQVRDVLDYLIKTKSASKIGANERAKDGASVRANARTLLRLDKYSEYQAKEPAGANGGASKGATKGPTKETTKQSTREANASKDAAAAAVLAPLVGAELSTKFIAFRRELKKPVTAVQAEAILGRIENHHDPSAVLSISISNGWQGIFPEKVPTNFKAINGGRNDQPSSKSETRLNAFVSGARGAS